MTNQEGTWLTPAALTKLQDELEQLKTTGREEVVARIAEARAHGDLKENSEYDSAKNDQGLMEARIRQLEHIIDSAHAAEVDDSGVVAVGTVATVLDPDGEEMEFFVAPAENKVPGILLASPDSPIGSALLGKRPGEQAEVVAPGGTFIYTVKAVRVYEG